MPAAPLVTEAAAKVSGRPDRGSSGRYPRVMSPPGSRIRNVNLVVASASSGIWTSTVARPASSVKATCTPAVQNSGVSSAEISPKAMQGCETDPISVRANSAAASKGSVSTATRMLQRMGWIERVRLRNERSGGFRVKSGVWSEVMRNEVGALVAIRDLAQRGLHMVGGDSRAAARLGEMRDFYAFLANEMPALVARYEQERRS